MMHGLPLDVRKGSWVHVRVVADPDDHSAEQQKRDCLLRDLALAIHAAEFMPTQGEHVARRSGNAGPHAARVDADPGQSPATTTECRRDKLFVSRDFARDTRRGFLAARLLGMSLCQAR